MSSLLDERLFFVDMQRSLCLTESRFFSVDPRTKFIHLEKSPFTHKRALLTQKIAVDIQGSLVSQNRGFFLWIHGQNSWLQIRAHIPQKSPIYSKIISPKEPCLHIYPQKSHIYPQKSPIYSKYPQKSPVHSKKSIEYVGLSCLMESRHHRWR